MINIYITHFDDPLPEKVFNEYLDLLPEDQKNKNQRFVRWQDKHLHLLGKLLLIEGLKQFGIGRSELKNLGYNENDRPCLKNCDIDFNISHSGNYAICAISEIEKVGVDIEIIQPIEFEDFKGIYTEKEWAIVKDSPSPMLKFYSFWTRKESIIKADGRGLSIPLDCFEVMDNIVSYDNQIWNLKELEIHPNYQACLASNMQSNDMKLTRVDF